MIEKKYGIKDFDLWVIPKLIIFVFLSFSKDMKSQHLKFILNRSYRY